MAEMLAYHRIEEIEEEIKELKREVTGARNVALGGIWGDISIGEEDFEEAEESLFKRGA